MAEQDSRRRRGRQLLAALAVLVAVSSCRVHREDGAREARLNLLEKLGVEVDNLEYEVRRLEREQLVLQRKVIELRRARDDAEQKRVEALQEQEGKRKALAAELEKLKFLEESLTAARDRETKVKARLAKIDSDEKRLATLKDREKLLPGAIEKLRAALTAPTAEARKLLADLTKKLGPAKQPIRPKKK